MKLIDKDDLQVLAAVYCGVINRRGRFGFKDRIDLTPFTFGDISPIVTVWEGVISCDADDRLESYATNQQ